MNKYPEKKLDVSFKIKALKNKNLEITAFDGFNSVSVTGTKIEESINYPITRENIIVQISKLGNTPFKIKDINIEMDKDIFISLKELNELRRNLTDKLIELKVKVSPKLVKKIEKEENYNCNKKIKMSVLVRNEEQLLTCLEEYIDNIYVTDHVLFNKYSNHSNIYLRTDRVANNFINYNNKNLLVTELGAINKYCKNNNVISDYYLNINNNKSINLLQKLGVKGVCLSPEIKGFNKINSKIDIEMIIYGRLELMITKYCPLNMLLNNDNKKCNLCLNKDKFYLKDDNDRCYPLLHNKHITHVMHYKNIDLIDSVNEYIDKGINCFRLELFDEDSKKVKTLISKLKGVFYE